MAEDATATSNETGEPPLIIVDGSTGTIVLEEDGAASRPPNSGAPVAADQPGLTVVIAERDPETGEITLVEGKSSEGDGRVQISGTDRVFEDQAAFETFLAEVNGKADAGVPFEDIIGNDVNAIPVVENGVATGVTLGGIEDGVAPGEVVQVGPSAGENPGSSPDAVADPDAAVDEVTPPPSFGSEPGESGRREGARDPDSAGDGSIPSANGDAGDGAFPDRNQNGVNDGFETLLEVDANTPPPTGPAVGERAPGRDENGNLLPGAEGRVTLDDFNDINDLDGNGINDGVENPVDLSGERDEEAPQFEPPPLRIIEPEPPFQAQEPGQPVDPGGDGSPAPPRGGVDIVVDPAPEPGPPSDALLPDDGLLPGDGLGVIRDPVAPVDVQNPTAPAEPPAPPVTAPELAVNPSPPEASEPPAQPAPQSAAAVPPAHAPPEGPPTAAPAAEVAAQSGNVPPRASPAESTPALANDGYDAPAARANDAISALDTFSSGTAPSESPVSEPPGPRDAPLAAVSPHEPVTSDVGAEAIAAEDYPPGDEGQAGLAAAASVATLGPAGAALGATDVFDEGSIAAAAVAGTSEEGGGNLLERIFEKVKDVLFDSGSSDPSPVQLPVQPDPVAADLAVVAGGTATEPVAVDDFDNPPLPEDTGDDSF